MAEREKESQQKSRRDDTSSEARALPKELPDPDLIAAKAAEAAKQKELARQKKARKEELEENKSRSRMDTKELEADSQVKWKAINGLEELATAGGRAPADLAAPVEEELPPETSSDRVPFPLNKSFISQPVLSERFRKEIWKAVIIDGKSVRQVSAAYNVEMSRVGAVVRLMEVQKEWERIVSFLLLYAFSSILFMMIFKNRLVYKTITWLQNLRMRASLKKLHLIQIFRHGVSRHTLTFCAQGKTDGDTLQ